MAEHQGEPWALAQGSLLSARPLRRWAVPLLLAAIVALGASVRIVGISDNPPGFFTDEASVGYNAYMVLKHGKDEHGEGWPVLFEAFGEYKLPVYIYSVVPFVAALGLSEFAVRFTSALYGTLTVVSAFLLASALFRQRSVGLAAALFLATTPWHIHYSRTGFGELVTFPAFLTLGLYLFLLSARGRKLWLATAVVFGLTLYTYRSAWIVLPPLLALLMVLYRREIYRDWRVALGSLNVVVIMAIPILVHLLGGSGDRSQEVSILNLNQGAWETFKTFAAQYRSYFSIGFLFDHGDDGAITRHYLPGFGQLYYLQLPFMVLGLLGLLIRPNREKAIVLALLVLYPLPGALSDASPISSRTILGPVVFSLLAGYGLMLAVNGLGRVYHPYGKAAAAVSLVVVLALAFASLASYLDRYHSTYPLVSAGYWGWQAGPKEIVEYFVSVEDGYDQLIMDGEFNAPWMFLRFYAPNACSKCVTGSAQLYDPARKQLFALKPKNIPPDYTYRAMHSITYPNGEPAFAVVEITGRSNRPPPTQ